MYIENVRAKKNFAKTLEALVFVRLPADPSPIQLIRHKRKERRSRFCAFVLAIVMLVGVFAQIGKLVDLAAANRSIKALKADNKLLEVSIENLKVELSMKTQDNVICHVAARDLGMVYADKNMTMVLPVTNTHTGATQMVSTGYQK